jgi:hypothetical protein
VVIVERGAEEDVWDVVGKPDGARTELITNEGRGLPGAINTGMRWGRTPFVALVFADDMLASEAVGTLTDHIVRYPDVDFFHSSRIVVDADDRPISGVYPSQEAFALEDFPWGSPVKHLLCWRRGRALAIGGLGCRFGGCTTWIAERPRLRSGTRPPGGWEMIESALAFRRGEVDGLT